MTKYKYAVPGLALLAFWVCRLLNWLNWSVDASGGKVSLSMQPELLVGSDNEGEEQLQGECGKYNIINNNDKLQVCCAWFGLQMGVWVAVLVARCCRAGLSPGPPQRPEY
jgi:hypothetical protein